MFSVLADFSTRHLCLSDRRTKTQIFIEPQMFTQMAPQGPFRFIDIYSFITFIPSKRSEFLNLFSHIKDKTGAAFANDQDFFNRLTRKFRISWTQNEMFWKFGEILCDDASVEVCPNTSEIISLRILHVFKTLIKILPFVTKFGQIFVSVIFLNIFLTQHFFHKWPQSSSIGQKNQKRQKLRRMKSFFQLIWSDFPSSFSFSFFYYTLKLDFHETETKLQTHF